MLPVPSIKGTRVSEDYGPSYEEYLKSIPVSSHNCVGREALLYTKIENHGYE